jgi:hypothetical protein
MQDPPTQNPKDRERTVTGSEVDASLPTFVVIGAMMAGTTTLNAWLGEHPDVCMSARKDLDFFLEDGNWQRGVGWYRLRFASCSGEKARGESSPNYSKTHADPEVAQRMYSVVPEARIVYLVREPIDLMRSNYRRRVIDGTETRSFVDAIAEDEDYQRTSRYIQHIGAYLKHYPKDRFLVITSELLAADPGATLAAVHMHLGVYPAGPPQDVGRLSVTDDRSVDSEWSLRLKANPAYWRALHRSWRLRNIHEQVFSRRTRVPSTQLPAPIEEDLRKDLEKDTQALEVFIGRRLIEWGR